MSCISCCPMANPHRRLASESAEFGRAPCMQTVSQPIWSGPPHRIQVFSLISPSLLSNCRSEDRILPSSIPRVLLGSLRSSPGTLGCRPGTRNQCCPWSIHLPVFYHERDLMLPDGKPAPPPGF